MAGRPPLHLYPLGAGTCNFFGGTDGAIRMDKSTVKIVVGTRNEGKVAELRGLLGGAPVCLVSLAEFGDLPEVEETGKTFAENAAIKAKSYAELTGHWAVADDSGLEVAALGGEPGVWSARYAGKGASDAENMAKLLSKLKNFVENERAACFVCEMAVAHPSGEIVFRSRGTCSGHITRNPLGVNGFGYDPVFVPTGFNRTFGELPDNVKAGISHRSAASEKIVDFLARFFGPTT